MEIRVAKTAGFCFGVKRAMDQVQEQIEKGTRPIATYGPIIHNQEVVRELEAQGVTVFSEEKLYETEALTGTMVIRSHGVDKAAVEKLTELGAEVVDATCPFVKKIHRIVSEKSREGYSILIAGNPDHPEVKGIVGWCEGPVKVVSEPDEIENLPEEFKNRVCFVAQTTYNHNKFNKCVAKFQKISYDNLVYNSICNATQERQEEAAEISAWADCMLVVGDRHSSNTQKLVEICQEKCTQTHFLQTADELDTSWLANAVKIGITAGASTPQKIIEEVKTKCQRVLSSC